MDDPCLSGDFGQLGNGDRSSSVTPVAVDALDDVPVAQISLGTAHNAVLTADGQVLTWGHGSGGRLGHGDEDDQLVPVPVSGLSSVKIAQVMCGELHTAALCEDGKLWTWGCGKVGA
jgi:alpha-tubulin suppressor-like RCC1 family protein